MNLFKGKVVFRSSKLTSVRKEYPSLSLKEVYHLDEFLKRIYNKELIWSKREDNPGFVSLVRWDEDIDHVMRSALYHAEQVNPLSLYKDDRESFDEAWASDVYEPSPYLAVKAEYVEVIEGEV